MPSEWEHSFRCPHCDGLNDIDAEWCMQCARRLRPERPKVDLNAGRPTAREVVGGALDIVGGPSYEGDDEGLRQAFVVGEKDVSWSCSRCGSVNPIAADTCRECGRSFMDTARVLSSFEVSRKQNRSTLKALGIVAGGAVVMRLVADLISPWAAAAFLGGAVLRFLVKYLRN